MKFFSKKAKKRKQIKKAKSRSLLKLHGGICSHATYFFNCDTSETMSLIIKFFSSSQMIQDVAFGVFSDKKTGLTMPRVIRLQKAKQCIETCQAFLQENGKVPPASSTFYKLMKYLPAAMTKVMSGINPTQDRCMCAFEELKKLVNKLAQLPHGLSNENKKNLIVMIENAHTYLRSHFNYRIEWESKIDSHCAKFALSDSEYGYKDLCRFCNRSIYFFESSNSN